MPARRSAFRPSYRRAEDPLAVLGLTDAATERDVNEARRRLAKRAHPDAGGSVEQMQRINDAADAALRHLAPPGPGRSHRAPSSPPREPAPRHGSVRRDHPSFTVEALPAEAFEALLVVASWMGDLIDDDPPYGLELALTDPFGGWCRLDLVPDAGSSTVSIAVAGVAGQPVPSVDVVRDSFVEGLNRLDWGSLHV
ncbi:MAG: hypothetical protein ACLGHQ_00195 [Acidimicrobiia bacterium]